MARELSRQGAELVSVVRDRAAAERIADSYDMGAEIAEVDLADASAVRRLIEDFRPAITFNLAGYGIDPTERDQGKMKVINADLPATLADAIASVADPAWPGQTIVHAGSGAEYGTTRGELSEDCATAPIGDYATSKLAGTRALAERASRSGLRTVTARLFTVYGPGEHRGRLLPCLIDASRSGLPVALSTGEQQRDFCYVEDVAEGMLRLGLSAADPGSTVNLSTGRLNSVRSFALTAARVLSIPLQRLEFGKNAVRTDEVWHGPVVTNRLRQLTGWVPTTDIAEGVRRTWAFEALKHDAGHPDTGITKVASKPEEHSDAA